MLFLRLRKGCRGQWWGEDQLVGQSPGTLHAEEPRGFLVQTQCMIDNSKRSEMRFEGNKNLNNPMSPERAMFKLMKTKKQTAFFWTPEV